MARAVVRGDKEAAAALRRLRSAVNQSIMNRAGEESLKPMAEQTRANARVLRQPHTPKGGHLDEGVAVARRPASGRGKVVLWLGFSRRARKIAHLVEFGTRPHFQPNYRGGWMHPGARPKPFLRPAYEARKREAIEIFAKRIGDVIRTAALSVRTNR